MNESTQNWLAATLFALSIVLNIACIALFYAIEQYGMILFMLLILSFNGLALTRIVQRLR